MSAPAASTVLARLPCSVAATDLWFSHVPGDVEAAKAACRPCPQRVRCLSGAIGREEPWGVWGGELVEDGVVVPRKRPRGRPPKARHHDRSGAPSGAGC